MAKILLTVFRLYTVKYCRCTKKNENCDEITQQLISLSPHTKPIVKIAFQTPETESKCADNGNTSALELIKLLKL